LNKLRLKLATPERVVYFYIPENKGNPGEVGINIGEEEAFVILRAENDTNTERYGFSAAKALKQCVERKNLPLEFTQAWY